MVTEVAWLTALILVPLIVLPFDPDPFVRPKLMVLCACAILAAISLPWRPVFDSMNEAVAAFLLAMVVATLASTDWRVSLLGGYGRGRGLITFLACAALYFALRQATDQQRQRAIGLILLIGTLVAVWSIQVWFTESTRLVGTQGNAIFLGSYLLAPTIIAASYARSNALSLLAATLMVGAIVLTRSRGPQLALGVGFLLLVPRGMRWAALLFSVALLYTTISYRGSWGIAERVGIWYITIVHYFNDGHWLIGTGPETFSAYWARYPGRRLDAAHSVPLQILVTSGLLGFGTWCAVWWRSLTGEFRYRWSLPAIAAVGVESLFGIATTTSLLMLFVILGLSK